MHRRPPRNLAQACEKRFPFFISARFPYFIYFSFSRKHPEAFFPTPCATLMQLSQFLSAIATRSSGRARTFICHPTTTIPPLTVSPCLYCHKSHCTVTFC